LIGTPGFPAALELELQLQGCAFRRADLLAFVASIWPPAQEDPGLDLLDAGIHRGGPGNDDAVSGTSRILPGPRRPCGSVRGVPLLAAAGFFVDRRIKGIVDRAHRTIAK
jgi:hypothetical protein